MKPGVPAVPEVSALLADGSTVRLRPAQPEDHARVLRPYDNMSAANLRRRFFGATIAGPEDLVARLSLMTDDLPELVEAECNPVVARPEGITVVDARIRLLPWRAWDPYLRRLP
ncbi:acetate--CoA ligase family protein [Streptomyces sp. NPDC056178]|uniref:acetate--CoA ligase family protein n=1 Tax=unclassified Streptomyces TaxID=2593676 RepID=UPI0035E07FC7